MTERKEKEPHDGDLSMPIKQSLVYRNSVSCGIRMTHHSAAPQLSVYYSVVTFTIILFCVLQRFEFSHIHHIKYGNSSAFFALGFDMTARVLVYDNCVMLTVRAFDVSWLLIDNSISCSDDLLLHLNRWLSDSDIGFVHTLTSSCSGNSE